ncbi:hypothetical protein BVC93_20200 [Mycobacterium sp. MS1601]|nr:hypothetical protein BVC93_20200 [Mycobacterium sp. MS1601]
MVCGFLAGRLLPHDHAAAWLLALASVLVLAGVFLHPVLSLRVALLPFLALMAVIGVGLGGYPALVATAAAVLAVVVLELVRRRWREDAARRQLLLAHGVSATGTVSWAWRFYVGGNPVTRVAVQFVDDDGRQWQARTSAAGVLEQGTRVRLRYLPDDPAIIEVLR